MSGLADLVDVMVAESPDEFAAAAAAATTARAEADKPKKKKEDAPSSIITEES